MAAGSLSAAAREMELSLAVVRPSPPVASRNCCRTDGVAAEHDGDQAEQARLPAQGPGGPPQSAQFRCDGASGLEGSDAAGAERMDLLDHLGQTKDNAEPPNPARGRRT